MMSKTNQLDGFVDNIALGYSASVCDSNISADFADDVETLLERATTTTTNKRSRYTTSIFSCGSTIQHRPSLSISSHHALSLLSNPNKKQEIILDKWYIYPVVGSHAIKVCGRRKYDGVLRQSGSITVRVHSHCVLTSKGSMYTLVGPIQPVPNIPFWFEEKFANGFPSSWKRHVDDYLEWLKQKDSDDECTVEENVLSDSNCKGDLKLDLHQWGLQLHSDQVFIEAFARNGRGKFQLYRTGFVDSVENKTLISTINGNKYNLKGPICLDATIQAGVPLWCAKAFNNGFPDNWRSIVAECVKRLRSHGGSFQLSTHSNPADSMSVHSRNMPQCALSLQRSSIKKNLFSADSDPDRDLSYFSVDVNVPATVIKRSTVVKRQNLNESAEPTVNDLSSNTETSLKTLEQTVTRKSKNDNAPEISQRKASTKRKKSKHCVKKLHISKTSTCAELPIVNSSFSTPTPGCGLYRTKSGRHVFPPLQSWTRQRLSSEFDENGNQFIRFHPGTDSALSTISPAAENLRKSTWIHKKFHDDQISILPSPQLDDVYSVSNRRSSKCVKKLLASPEEEELDKIRPSNQQKHNLSCTERGGVKQTPPLTETMHRSNTDSTHIINVSSKAIQIQKDGKTSNSAIDDNKQTQKATKATNDDVRPRRYNLRTCSQSQKKESTVSSQSNNNVDHKSKGSKSNRLKPKKLKEEPPTEKNSKTINLRTRNCNLKSGSDLSKNCNQEDNEKRKIIGKVKEKDSTIDTANKKRKRLPSSCGKETLKRRRKSSCTKKVQLTPVNHSKCVQSKVALGDKTLKIFVEDCLINTELSKTVEQPVLRQTNLNNSTTSKTRDPKKKPRRRKKQIKTNSLSSNKENPPDSCLPVRRISQDKNKAAAKGDVTAITAKRGSMKRRQQVKENAVFLSKAKQEQDLFTSQPSSLPVMFDDKFFKVNASESAAPVTPSSSRPFDFDQYVATPAWFKTPIALNAHSISSMETPAHLKSFFPDEDVATKQALVADKIVVQFQNEKKKKKNVSTKTRKTEKSQRKQKKPLTLPSDLFLLEADKDEEYSDEDEYFSE